MKSYAVNFVSVVVPVYNEEGCLEELISRSLAALEKTGKRYELILVDDGSRDRSVEIMTRATETHPGQVVACILNRNYGQHSAIMAGFSLVRGDLVITIDADLQNPPEEFPRLVEAAEAGNDVVGTVRQNRKDSLLRTLPSKIVNIAAQRATGVKMHDYGCMLRAYRRHVVEAMKLCNERSTFIPVLGNSFARNTCEIPVGHSERAAGESKYSFFKLINLQFNLLTCMTTFPLRLMTYVGSGLAFFGFLLSIYIIIRRLFDSEDWSAQGVFTLFAIQFIICGVLLIGMGLLGEYIGRIYTDVRARPQFFIESVIGREDEAEKDGE